VGSAPDFEIGGLFLSRNDDPLFPPAESESFSFFISLFNRDGIAENSYMEEIPLALTSLSAERLLALRRGGSGPPLRSLSRQVKIFFRIE